AAAYEQIGFILPAQRQRRPDVAAEQPRHVTLGAEVRRERRCEDGRRNKETSGLEAEQRFFGDAEAKPPARLRQADAEPPPFSEFAMHVRLLAAWAQSRHGAPFREEGNRTIDDLLLIFAESE